MHLAVEARQVALARPLAGLVLVAAGSAVAVGPVAVVRLQDLLVLALQVVLQDDAADLEAIVRITEPNLLLPKRRVEIRDVVGLSGAPDARVRSLGKARSGRG